MDLFAEILHTDTHSQERKQGEDGQLQVDGHENADGQNSRKKGVYGVHDSGSEHHANSTEVIGGPRHDVTGGVALVKAGGKGLKMGKQVVAKIVFNVSGDADQDSPHQETEEPFHHAGCDQEYRIIKKNIAADFQIELIDGVT